MKKQLFALALAGALVILTTVTASAQSAKDETLPVNAHGKVQTVKLKVAGLTCAGDSMDIQKVVSKLNGVTSCTVVGKPSATSTFEVSFDPALISEKELRKAVESTPGCENPAERPYKVKQYTASN